MHYLDATLQFAKSGHTAPTVRPGNYPKKKRHPQTNKSSTKHQPSFKHNPQNQPSNNKPSNNKPSKSTKIITYPRIEKLSLSSPRPPGSVAPGPSAGRPLFSRSSLGVRFFWGTPRWLGLKKSSSLYLVVWSPVFFVWFRRGSHLPSTKASSNPQTTNPNRQLRVA